MTSRIAWSLLGANLAYPFLAPLLLGWLLLRPGYAISAVFTDVWISALMVLPFAIVGTLVAIRRPENRLGWLMLGLALSWQLSIVADVFVKHRAAFTGALSVWIAWTGAWMASVSLGAMLTLIPLLFPTGHLPSRRWRPVLWLSLAAILLWMIHDAFGPEAVDDAVLPDALHVPALVDILAVTNPLAALITAVAVLASITSLVVRFRHSHGVERQQIKWLTFVGGLIPPLFAVAAVTVVVDPENQGGAIGAIGWIGALVCGIIGVPVAMGIAILRHRLYDIDVIINRALVYGTLTASLGLVYTGSILLFQATLRPVIGSSDVAVAALTLAAAAVFRPLRSRIQAGVDHRFYRRRYDAARTVAAFATRMRDEVDLATLSEELRAVTRETMQPAHVSLWLRPIQRG